MNQSVHKHITQEYVRTCLIAYESLPTDAHHEGWGKPGEYIYEASPSYLIHGRFSTAGTQYSGVRFRRTLLDTITKIGPYISFFGTTCWRYIETDGLAHSVIPSHPPSKPHARMLHRFRFILPLLSVDEDGLTSLHYYDSAVQIARNGNTELSEQEFAVGMRAVRDIEQWSVAISLRTFFFFFLLKLLLD